MARRSVTKLRYFHGETEIEEVRWFRVDAEGKPIGTNSLEGIGSARFGVPVGVSAVDLSAYKTGYRRDWLRLEREVKFKAKPDAHKCDWRCLGARPGGECWCECGGRNHGREFVCAEIAA